MFPKQSFCHLLNKENVFLLFFILVLLGKMLKSNMKFGKNLHNYLIEI